jgi:predicted sulfurtransferase
MRTHAVIAALAGLVALAPAGGRTSFDSPDPLLAQDRQSADAIDAPRVSMQEFKKLLAAKNVVVVDTRNPDEFNAGHMAGALFLPLEGRLTWPDEYETVVTQLIATRRPVVTYCA